MKAYYDARAREYDDWIHGVGVYADRDRPGWSEELAALEQAVRSLPPARTLDVAAGSGYFTRFLPGHVVALDQSANMIEVANELETADEYVLGDALELPFEDGSFERVFTGHFYGHLEDDDRRRFLSEAARVASELVIVDSSRAAVDVDEEMQSRELDDGSQWEVYKRWFTGDGLTRELGGGDVLLDGRWFVAVRSPL